MALGFHKQLTINLKSSHRDCTLAKFVLCCNCQKYLALLFAVLVTYEALIIMNDYTVPMHVEPLHEGIKRFPSGLKCCTGLILENCTDNEFASK